MPSTHLSLHYHVVFSTKDRARIIRPEWRAQLHGYIGGIIQNLDAIPESIGGTDDHVHILIGLRATHCLANVVRDIKSNSSGWVREHVGDRTFAWQEGYGAFTVSARFVPQVRRYIDTQEDHHKTRTFQEEYVAFLKRGSVDFDERFLW